MQCAVKVLVLPPGWEGLCGPNGAGGGGGGGGGGGRRVRLAREVALTTTLRSPYIGGCEAVRKREPGPADMYSTVPVCTAHWAVIHTFASSWPASFASPSRCTFEPADACFCGPHLLTPAVPTWDYTIDTIPIHGDRPNSR